MEWRVLCVVLSVSCSLCGSMDFRAFGKRLGSKRILGKLRMPGKVAKVRMVARPMKGGRLIQIGVPRLDARFE